MNSRLPESTFAFALRHWVFLFLLLAVPCSAVANPVLVFRVPVFFLVVVVGVVFALVVNRGTAYISKKRICLCMFVGVLVYCSSMILLVDLVIKRDHWGILVAVPAVTSFALAVCAIGGAILALSTIA